MSACCCFACVPPLPPFPYIYYREKLEVAKAHLAKCHLQQGHHLCVMPTPEMMIWEADEFAYREFTDSWKWVWVGP